MRIVTRGAGEAHVLRHVARPVRRGAAEDADPHRPSFAQVTGQGSGVDLADADDALVAQLQQHVKGKLAPYEYPKEIEFIDALPMTTTGKVQRRVLRLQEEEKARGPAA